VGAWAYENQKVARSRISAVSSENACATDTYRVTTTMLGGYGQLPPRGPDVLHAHPPVAGPLRITFRSDLPIPYCLKTGWHDSGGVVVVLLSPVFRIETDPAPGSGSLDRR
jgi:hypothetical protein